MSKQSRVHRLGCLLAAFAVLTCATSGTAGATMIPSDNNQAIIASSDQQMTDPAMQYAITKGYLKSTSTSYTNTPVTLSDFCYAAIACSKTTLDANTLHDRIEYLKNLYIKAGLLPDTDTISNLDAICFLDRVWKINSALNIDLNITGTDEANLNQLDALSDMAAKGLIPNDPSFDVSDAMTYQDLANILARRDGILEKTNQDVALLGSSENDITLYQKIASQYTSKQVLTLFDEVALKSEYTDTTGTHPSHNLVRWADRTITYSVIGEDISEDIYTAIADALVELDDISYTPSFQLDETGNGALQIYVGGETANQMLSRYNATGLSTISYDKTVGSIVKGTIYLQDQYQTPSRTKHVVLEELTQVLGLVNDTVEFQDSIFYDGFSSLTQLTDIDKLLIEMLYSDAVKPNMTPPQCKANLATWLTEHVFA